ncbi:MAG TPA: RIP metalloprotease RseP [Chitinophagaceae bacterium]|nr:RIP metalloprotease RseP [Chitinophagales bacterium]HPG10335.1 RIP metalloprotease RseP [Chitinophagaceae bacterium]HRX94955.1 RIP metalloprotease RseP [Chitinophagaceae bacterium]
MNLLAINWSNVGLQAGQLLLALSLLVLLHEFGHYITARWFKCRVEKFFLFFDPWFSLFKKKIGDTVYGIGWLPLGGYVKISGMIDESMDKEQMKQPPKEWEFRSKPAWQRLIVMLGGIIMNVLVAFVIYAFILMIWGEKKTPIASVKNGIWVTDTIVAKLGFQNGDKIISVNGDSLRYFEDVQSKILIGGRDVVLERDGEVKKLTLPIDLVDKFITRRDRKRKPFIIERVPSVVGEYPKKDTSFGKQAGLQLFDNIIAVNGSPVQFMDQINDVAEKNKSGKVDITVLRGTDTLSLVSKVSEEGRIGIYMLSYEQYDSMGVFDVTKTRYGFLAAFPAGVKLAGQKLKSYIDQFKLILNPKTGAYKGVGGFKAIGSIFPTYWSWEAFWNITAFLSIILAFMNLLPIPALDGGHVMFTLYEMITRRKPNEKFLEYAQIVGMVILLALMLYANGNDWFGWGR